MSHAEKSTTETMRRPPMAFHVSETCELLNVSRSTFRKLVDQGDIRTVRLGGRVLVPATEIDRILAGEASR